MMSSTETSQQADKVALWTARLADAKRRGDRDLAAGCIRNLRAARREIASRKGDQS